MHLIFSLSPGGDIWLDNGTYIRRNCGSLLVMQSENTSIDKFLSRIGLTRRSVPTTSLIIRGEDYDLPDLSFLERMHQPVDSDLCGFSSIETYYPACYTVVSQLTERLCLTGFSCPHCAYMSAKDIMSSANAPNGKIPSIYYIGPDNTYNAHPMVTLDEDTGTPRFDTKTVKMTFDERGCSSCGWPGHNSRSCTAPPRAYDLIGIEIEGRFENRRDVERLARSEGLGTTGDGSIHRGDTDATPMEIQTKPELLAGALRQLAKFYPDETDESCGMHVHVSFKDIGSFSLLASPEFGAYFTQRWRDWGTRLNINPRNAFWKRLNGENDYCNPNSARDFNEPFGADRYRQLNFHAWNEHKTVECRLLPMFREARLAFAAVTELISIYEDWIHKHAADYFPATTAKVEFLSVQSQATSVNVGDLSYFSSSTKTEFTSTIEVATVPPLAPGFVRILANLPQTQQLRFVFPTAERTI